jgi:hypothetical protein
MECGKAAKESAFDTVFGGLPTGTEILLVNSRLLAFYIRQGWCRLSPL